MAVRRKVPNEREKDSEEKGEACSEEKGQACAEGNGRAWEARKATRKEEVHGYTPGLPDLQEWPDIAIELKVRPCYSGKDSVPFSRLRARLFRVFTDVYHPTKDEFYLEEPAAR